MNTTEPLPAENHTPGPWLVREGDEWTRDIVTRDGQDVNGEPMFWNVASCNLRRDESRANARLIAAAPELLEALEWLWREVRESGNGKAQDFRWPQAREKTIAALEKALG